MGAQELPVLGLITTGGTIASLGSNGLDLAYYGETGNRISGQELVDQVPEVCAYADIDVVDFRRGVSTDLSVEDCLELAAEVDGLLARHDVAGVVVTHGTGLLEETAYLLDLITRSSKPVVVTGSMRPASAISADGPLNLVNAVRIAASPHSADRGVLVTMSDEIFSAREATKVATAGVHAFSSRDHGPLGFVQPDGKISYWRPAVHHSTPLTFNLTKNSALPRVDIVVSCLGADGRLIDAVVAVGAAGIVSAGVGSGITTPAETVALDRAVASGVVVCQASRVGAGRVTRKPSHVRRGVVTAGDLLPWKARILLSLCLTVTRDLETIQQVMSAG